MSKYLSISDLFSLKGKNALVTGGLGNLGPWWSLALIEAGAKVIIIDLPNTKLPEILQNISPKQLKVYFADITNPEGLIKVHKEISQDFGLVEILINNAGIDAPPVKNNHVVTTSGGGRPQPHESYDSPEVNKLYKKMWEVNVQGMVNCIEEFYPDMKKIGGSIINIGSLYLERSPYEGLYTHLGFDKPWAYGATKAAVGQITRHYATRLAKYNIRVNTLSPGGVFNNQDKEFVKKFSQRVPLGRMAEKEKDLGGPLIFLASDASSYITGINLQVNGGYTSW